MKNLSSLSLHSATPTDLPHLAAMNKQLIADEGSPKSAKFFFVFFVNLCAVVVNTVAASSSRASSETSASQWASG
jgi:hypothetical protein